MDGLIRFVAIFLIASATLALADRSVKMFGQVMKRTALGRIPLGVLALKLTMTVCAVIFPCLGQGHALKEQAPEPHSFDMVKVENSSSGKRVVKIRFSKKPETNR